MNNYNCFHVNLCSYIAEPQYKMKLLGQHFKKADYPYSTISLTPLNI